MSFLDVANRNGEFRELPLAPPVSTARFSQQLEHFHKLSRRRESFVMEVSPNAAANDAADIAGRSPSVAPTDLTRTKEF
jgi:hypothetical protein